jgi:hypothetical protein
MSALQLSTRVPSRNAEWRAARPVWRCNDGVVIWIAQCALCGGRMDLASSDGEQDGQPAGKVKLFMPHCCTCRNRDHNSCVGCGACLPSWRRWKGGQRSQRLDARYCSNACRQRAYRRRQAEEQSG